MLRSRQSRLLPMYTSALEVGASRVSPCQRVIPQLPPPSCGRYLQEYTGNRYRFLMGTSAEESSKHD